MKYKIGDTIYWVEANTHYGKQIPCPMCFGKMFVTIILGDDSQTKIECGFCQHGMDRPSGIAKTWEPIAITYSGVITGVSSRDGIKYEVGYRSISERDIFESAQEAEVERLIRFEEVKTQAENWFKDNFVQAKKKQIWSAGYHRECIKREERTIEWHKFRLQMIKDKAPTSQAASKKE